MMRDDRILVDADPADVGSAPTKPVTDRSTRPVGRDRTSGLGLAIVDTLTTAQHGQVGTPPSCRMAGAVVS